MATVTERYHESEKWRELRQQPCVFATSYEPVLTVGRVHGARGDLSYSGRSLY